MKRLVLTFSWVKESFEKVVNLFKALILGFSLSFGAFARDITISSVRLL